METAIKQLEITVYGRVQGVNFRRSVAGMANSLRLKGYVENLGDGSVYVLAQGSESQLDELLRWSQKGAFPAKVSGMNFSWKDKIAKKYKSFKVKRKFGLVRDQIESFKNLGKSIILNKGEIEVPKHVVVIPDGNRRWAREKGWKAYVGHKKAANFERILNLFYECKALGVEYLTMWGFSTENWQRDKEEVDQIFEVTRKLTPKVKKLLIKEQIKFKHLGRKDRLPKDILKSLEELEAITKDFSNLHFQLCLDYGGRSSLVDAFNKMLRDGITEVDEEIISKYLETKDIPEPDLIIRTSGEKRLSGMMPYEGVYAELYFTNVHFPDFDGEQFQRAILDYSSRRRRFGNTHEQDLALKQTLIDPDVN